MKIDNIIFAIKALKCVDERSAERAEAELRLLRKRFEESCVVSFTEKDGRIRFLLSTSSPDSEE